MKLSDIQIAELLEEDAKKSFGSTVARRKYPDLTLLDEVWIAWSAGFIDADGSINIMRTKDIRHKSGYQFTVRLQGFNIIKAPIDKLILMYGGSINTQIRTSCNPLYGWNINGQAACRALKAIRPYLMIKGLLADCAIEFQEKHLGNGSSTLEERNEHFYRMRALQTRVGNRRS